MAVAGILFDEHLSTGYIYATVQRLPHIAIHAAGRGIAPPKRTPDPSLIVWAEEHHCYPATLDHGSMPVHLRDHLPTGRHIDGILILPRGFRIGPTVDRFELIFGATFPDEYLNQAVYL